MAEMTPRGGAGTGGAGAGGAGAGGAGAGSLYRARRWRWSGIAWRGAIARHGRAPAAALVAVAVLATAAVLLFGRPEPTRRLVAHFTSAVGISAGSEVRVLGVKIGRVTSVRPQGGTVRVAMSYDARQPIPAGAEAVIVPPSVISDRYIQLTPGYSGGPVLPDGADLPTSRTIVPLEIDDVYRALNQFAQALGPRGANSGGALSKVIAAGAANLSGNGQRLHDTIANTSRTLQTLANGSGDLFGTVVDLQKFTATLVASDQRVRAFNDELAAAGEQLAGEGPDLAAMLRALATALAAVTTFLHDNRAELTADVGGLASVTGVLVREQRALIDVLDVAPLALSNLNLAYNARSGTLDTRDDAMGPYGPAEYVCSLAVGLMPTNQVPAQCAALARTLAARHLPMTDQLRELVGAPPAGSAVSSPGSATVGGLPAPAPGSPRSGAGAGSSDPTLGGILGSAP